MSEETTVNVSSDIKPFLDDISERLWSGHAAIMVGAGFSKNAEPVNGAKNTFPNWAELGDVFYEKVNGERPKGNNKYLNALKLADEVSAAFGRPALDQILKKHIDDDNHKPNGLFHKLLELNWSDVFTTNYDTLLERAKDNITERNYQVVVRKEDLISSQSPRIIKLHGSFPSHTPFIISEEDYRTYPKKFAPFVNTVQQTLLEKSLCLVGFSGDDPNFLQWIGWIRDNFPESTPLKIYLVGVISLSEAQRKLLDQRHINIVNFSSTKDVNNNHEIAFNLFFDYLKSKKKKKNFLDWPNEPSSSTYPDPNKENEESEILNVLPIWASSRLQYPGWRILPKDRRSVLKLKTERWETFCKDFSKLNDLNAFTFLYELNWRLDKCLTVTWDDIARATEGALEKIWPFSSVSPLKKPKYTINGNSFGKDIVWADIREQWIFLSFSMLRYYREEGDSEGWQNKRCTLKNVINYLSPEDKAKLAYEEALQYLFQIDINGLKDHLEQWEPSNDLPFWGAKRAGLLAELGETSKAKLILENALKRVRQSQSLKPITFDYSNISDESYILLLISSVKQSEMIASDQYDFEKTRTPSDRRNFLYQYKCDPWAEFDELSSFLDKDYSPRKIKRREYLFDIGYSSEQLSFQHDNRDALKGYEFLRLCEDIGFPFQMPGLSTFKETAIGAIKRISYFSPHWSLIALLRTVDEEAIDILFSRKAISQLSREQTSMLIDLYLKSLKTYKDDIEKPWSGYRKAGLSSKLGVILPEILSRLITKSEASHKRQVLSYLITLFSESSIENYNNVGNLYRRILSSLTGEEVYSLIPEILRIKIPKGYDSFTAAKIKNPFRYINLDPEIIKRYKKPKIDHKIINSLVDDVSSDNENVRSWALYSLVSLHTYDLLSKNNLSSMVESAWSILDDSGFPKGDIFKGYWSRLPSPKGTEIKKLTKGFILSKKIEIQTELENPNSLRVNAERISLLDEIMISKDDIDYSNDDVLNILDSLIEWWDKDKVLLDRYSENERIHKMTVLRFLNIPRVLADFVIPKANGNKKIIDKTGYLIEEFSSKNLPCLKVKASLQRKSLSNDLRKDIEQAFGSSNEFEYDDAFNALLILCENKDVSKNAESIIVNAIGLLSWRDSPRVLSLSVLHEIFLMDISLYTEAVEEKILLALTRLYKTTSYKDADSKSIHQNLDVRKYACKLAFTLYEKYYSQFDLPKGINVWKELSQSDDEFDDIRIEWPDT